MKGMTPNRDDEAGEVDNRMSLDPSDSRWSTAIGSWKDGQTYSFPSVEMRQISPGEFEIISVKLPGASEEEAPKDRGTGGEGNAEKGADEYPNPAVRGLMRKK